MIVVANRIAVAPGHEDRFEAAFADSEAHVRGQPGLIRNLVLRPIQGDHYIVMSFWRDRASFDSWTSSDAFRASHRGGLGPEAFSGRPTLEIHEIVHDVAR